MLSISRDVAFKGSSFCGVGVEETLAHSRQGTASELFGLLSGNSRFQSQPLTLSDAASFLWPPCQYGFPCLHSPSEAEVKC